MNANTLPGRLGLFEAIGHTSIGMLLMSYDGKITMVNQRTEETFGYTSGELNDFQIDQLIPPPTTEDSSSIANYLISLCPREIGTGQKITGLKKDGSQFPVVIGLSAVESNQEKMVLATIVDITIPHETEEKNKRLIEELETTKTELEGFSYSVSHDLRAPLRAIDGYSKILQEDYYEKFDDEGQRIVDIIIRNVGKMGMLIDDVLRFSRLGRQHISRSEVDMKALAQSVLDELSFEYSDRKMDITIGELPSVLGDYAMFKQIWANLIGNAIKYSGPRDLSVIKIDGYLKNDIVHYSIEDNGVGFNMAYVDKVFDVFQRLHKEKDFKGTGVGLALVQRIVHRHQGQVSASSVEGEGSTFRFSLPLKIVIAKDI